MQIRRRRTERAEETDQKSLASSVARKGILQESARSFWTKVLEQVTIDNLVSVGLAEKYQPAAKRPQTRL